MLKDSIIRWVFTLTALFIAGPAARALVRQVEAADGSQSVPMLVSATPAAGVVAIVGVVLIAAVVGLVAARVANYRHGLYCAGIIFAWAGWASGSILDWARAGRDHSPTLVPVAVDGVVLMVAGVVLASMIAMVGRIPKSELPKAHLTETPLTKRVEHAPVVSVSSAKAVVAALAGGVVAAWVVARTPDAGQIFAAAACAGFLGGLVGRLTAFDARPVLAVVGVLVLAAAAPIAGAIVTSDLPSAAMMRTLLALAWVTPFMWVGGALFGGPLGMAWADSLAEGQAEKADAAAKSAPRIKRAGA